MSSDVISRRLKDFAPIIPLYFGWFLNEDDSKSLIDTASDVYLKCLNEISCFSNDLKKINKTGMLKKSKILEV